MIQLGVSVAKTMVLFLTGITTMTGYALGCPGISDRTLSAELRTTLAAKAVAEDHRTAALIYRKQAQEAEIMASELEDSAKAMTHLEDPKEFRRSSLKTAAQQCRKEAAEFRSLADEHQRIADTP